jgi:hypothetical protein
MPIAAFAARPSQFRRPPLWPPLFWTARHRAPITPTFRRARPGGLGAQVAQLVEHCTENAGVGGSIPPLGTISFPTVSLAAARARRDDARKLLANGTDPSVKRKLDKIAAATLTQNTFGAVAAEYLAHMEANGASESTLSKNRWMLQDLAAPLGNRAIAEIVAAEILIVLKRIGKSGRRESARRAARCHSIPLN